MCLIGTAYTSCFILRLIRKNLSTSSYFRRDADNDPREASFLLLLPRRYEDTGETSFLLLLPPPAEFKPSSAGEAPRPTDLPPAAAASRGAWLEAGQGPGGCWLIPCTGVAPKQELCCLPLTRPSFHCPVPPLPGAGHPSPIVDSSQCQHIFD